MNLTVNSFIVSCNNQNFLRDTTHLVFVMRTLLFPGLLTFFSPACYVNGHGLKMLTYGLVAKMNLV